MTFVDYKIGAAAEYLNAYSVFQRIIGSEPSAGVSQVAQQYGSFGEFAAVVIANCMVGGIIVAVYRWLLS